MRSQEFLNTEHPLKRRELGLRYIGNIQTSERNKVMSLLVIFYWILLLLWVIGAFSAGAWPHWVYANAIILLILFIIIGIKLLPPHM